MSCLHTTRKGGGEGTPLGKRHGRGVVLERWHDPERFLLLQNCTSGVVACCRVELGDKATGSHHEVGVHNPHNLCIIDMLNTKVMRSVPSYIGACHCNGQVAHGIDRHAVKVVNQGVAAQLLHIDRHVEYAQP